MGISTKGYLKSDITAYDVFSIIASKFDKDATIDVKISKYNNREAGSINFNYDNEQRRIYYCVGEKEQSHEQKMFEGESKLAFLIFNCWGNSVHIMTEIVKEFGGYIDENDCDDIDAFYIEQDGDFFYSEYVIERDKILKLLDKNLSENIKFEIATQILKHKEELKNIW